MNASEFFPSKYLKAQDLTSPRDVTIAGVTSDMLGQGADAERKLIVTFRELSRGLVLNKTNYCTLLELTGSSDTDAWTGRRVRLVSARVDFQGKRVPAIRIEPVGAAAESAVGF